MNHCRVCNQDLPSTHFYKDSSRKNGLMNVCKICDDKRTMSRDNRAGNIRRYKRYVDRHNERYTAHFMVKHALKKGELTRLQCFTCGIEKTEAHHADYSNPLGVIWLCKTHHLEVHGKQKR